VKEESRQLLDKGGRALKAAETLLREGDPEFAAGRAYYAMLHVAQALLREKGLQYRRHSGVHAAFGEHFAKTGLLDRKYHRWLLDAFDERLRGDYDFQTSFDTESVALWIAQAREFWEVAERLLEEGQVKGRD
jgi:uncharacterized protein (UPF0332 family)